MVGVRLDTLLRDLPDYRGVSTGEVMPRMGVARRGLPNGGRSTVTDGARRSSWEETEKALAKWDRFAQALGQPTLRAFLETQVALGRSRAEIAEVMGISLRRLRDLAAVAGATLTRPPHSRLGRLTPKQFQEWTRAVPLKMVNGYLRLLERCPPRLGRPVIVWLGEDLSDELEIIAERDGISFQTLLRRAAHTYVRLWQHP
jgi:hypothetical protein